MYVRPLRIFRRTPPQDPAQRKGKNMLIKQLAELFDLLDSSTACAAQVTDYLRSIRPQADIRHYDLVGPRGDTEMIHIRVPGTQGKTAGGTAPTLGMLGRLGGLGARPAMTGFVSDGDGALTALTVAAKLLDMQKKGDFLEGDVVISTHICPDAPTQPHDPVPFMGSPVEMSQVNREEVGGELDAILSVDTTKGNRIINHRGFAISPTVKEGYILRVSEPLLDIMQTVTGQLPRVFALTTQDITPYGNGVYHLNSILQPATATGAPVVGVAITTEVPVAGCATGASHFVDLEETARYVLEVAKYFGRGQCPFFDAGEFARIKTLYGSMEHLQTLGKEQ